MEKRLILTLLVMGIFFSALPLKAQADEDNSRNILKQGLLGAGTGAIAASASGGKAGKGALIGAGTNIIGGALLDSLTAPSQPPPPAQPQVVYVQQAPQALVQSNAPEYSNQTQGNGPASPQLKKKITRKYDSQGHVVSEEETWV